MLSKEQLIRPRRLTREVKLSDGSALVRALSGAEALVLEEGIRTASGNLGKLLCVQLVAFVCDKDGKALLSDEDAALVFQSRSADDIRAICEAGMALNGFGPEGVEAAGGN